MPDHNNISPTTQTIAVPQRMPPKLSVEELTCGTARFAADVVLVEEVAEEETIFHDEIEDGLAECALAQAKIWAEAIREGDEGVDAELVQAIMRMSAAKTDTSKGDTGKGKQGVQDLLATHLGVFSSSVRLQPRYEKGQAEKFDSMVSATTSEELRFAQASLAAGLHGDFARLWQGASVAAKPAPDRLRYVPSGPSSQDLLRCQPSKDDEQVGLVLINEQMQLAGFAGDQSPRAVFPAIVGRCRHKGVMVGMGQKDAYVGDEAQSKRGILTLKYPLDADGGVTSNWDDQEKLWHHCFYNELRVAPEEHPVIVSEPAVNPQANREKLVQIMFETFNVPSLLLLTSVQLAMIPRGMSTGVVVEVGTNHTHVVAVIEGALVPEATLRLDVGDGDLIDYLMRIIAERGYAFTTTAEREILRDIKTKLSFVAEDYTKEMERSTLSNAMEQQYELPDGQIIVLANERFRCMEPLFQPNFVGKDDQYSLPLLVAAAISQCPRHLWTQLYGSVILAGQYVFQGLAERLNVELQRCCPPEVQVKIHSPESKYDTWMGGSLFATWAASQGHVYITKAEYDVQGPAVVSKCLGAIGRPALFIPPPTAAQQAQSKRERELELARQFEAEAARREQRNRQRLEKSVSLHIKQTMPSPNVLHVPMSALATPLATPGKEPFACEGCGARLSVMSVVNADYEWKCEFCAQINLVVLDDDEKPSSGVTELVVSPESSAEDDAIIVFCVDVSGSMYMLVEADEEDVPLPKVVIDTGRNLSRMMCVQGAVYAHIELMQQRYPTQRPVLLTFADTVKVYTGAATEPQLTVSTDLHDFDTLRKRAVGLDIPTAHAGGATLLQVVAKLLYSGETALGPSVAVALGLTSQAINGSKIIVCTDGIANLGLGSMVDEEAAKRCFSQMGEAARMQGTSISVVSLRGTTANLEVLGILPKLTNGNMDVVDPVRLTMQLRSMACKETVATGVSVTCRLPRPFQFLDRAGKRIGGTALAEMGMVTTDTDLMFPFSCCVDDEDEVQGPVQSQTDPVAAQVEIRYSRRGGTRVRVSTRQFTVTPIRDDCEMQLNPAVLGTSAIHTAADRAQVGDYKAARVLLISTLRLLQRALAGKRVGQSACYINYVRQAERLDGFMRISQEQAAIFQTNTTKGSKGADQKRDDTASRNILQMRNCGVAQLSEDSATSARSDQSKLPSTWSLQPVKARVQSTWNQWTDSLMRTHSLTRCAVIFGWNTELWGASGSPSTLLERKALIAAMQKDRATLSTADELAARMNRTAVPAPPEAPVQFAGKAWTVFKGSARAFMQCRSGTEVLSAAATGQGIIVLTAQGLQTEDQVFRAVSDLAMTLRQYEI